MNEFNATGRLTSDVKLKEGKKDNQYVSFTLAIPRDYKNKDGQIEADFIDCIAFNGLANTIANYLKKGSHIALNGYFRSSKYTNENDEVKHKKEIVIRRLNFLDKKEVASQIDDFSLPFEDETFI